MASSYHNENGVFKNKYGIDDDSQLNALEYQISARRTKELTDGSFQLKNTEFNLDRLQETHHHIFKDVYEWAGKVRSVPSSKRAPNGQVSVFSDADLINEKWALLANKTKTFTEIKNNTLSNKIDALVDIYAEANHIHPFPEGNGRSLQVFMKQLANTQDVDLDFSKVDSREWNNASSLSGIHGRLFEHRDLIQSKVDKEPIRKILNEIATDIQPQKIIPVHESKPNAPQALGQRPIITDDVREKIRQGIAKKFEQVHEKTKKSPRDIER